MYRIVLRYSNSRTRSKMLFLIRKLLWSPSFRSTFMYILFSLFITKSIHLPTFNSPVTVLWISTYDFSMITMLPIYSSKMFPSTRFNVSVCGMFLMTLSSAILKRTGIDIAPPCFSPLLIINEGDNISFFILTRLLGFVLHSCIMLISLFGKPKPIRIFNSFSLFT